MEKDYFCWKTLLLLCLEKSYYFINGIRALTVITKTFWCQFTDSTTIKSEDCPS